MPLGSLRSQPAVCRSAVQLHPSLPQASRTDSNTPAISSTPRRPCAAGTAVPSAIAASVPPAHRGGTPPAVSAVSHQQRTMQSTGYCQAALAAAPLAFAGAVDRPACDQVCTAAPPPAVYSRLSDADHAPATPAARSTDSWSGLAGTSAPPSPAYASTSPPAADVGLAQAATQGVVKVTLGAVRDGNVQAELQQAYGRGGLGLMVVAMPPEYALLRRRLMQLTFEFMTLPSHVKEYLEDAPSHYSVGRSFGKEQLKDGQPDTLKESFYFGLYELLPATDGSRTAAEARMSQLAGQYPAYYRNNLWPERELPELRAAALEAARVLRDTALLLARQMDRYVGVGSALEQQLRSSCAHKARLLGYHPQDASSCTSTSTSGTKLWCTEHTDHGSLTGLMPAMFFDKTSRMPVPSPDPSAGLYVRQRDGSTVQIRIPEDCVAFQIGEAAQVATGDLLQATPHYVQAPEGRKGDGVVRVTLAVFLQPDVTELMDPPAGMASSVPLWTPGMTFGAFAETRFSKYYPQLG